VQMLNAPRRLLVQAHVGRALADAQRGDETSLRAEAMNAFIVESTRATVSRLDPFWDLGLSPQESSIARAVLRWGQAKAVENQDPGESYKALRAACSLLKNRPDRVSVEELTPGQLPWGLEVEQTLASIWKADCEREASSVDEEVGDSD
jgi:hypothetical protein